MPPGWVEGLLVLRFEFVWSEIPEARVGPDGVVVLAPGLDQWHRLLPGAEPFHVEALVAEAAVEALVGAVLPGLSGSDVRGGDVRVEQPAHHGRRDKLRAVVGAEVAWSAVHADEPGELVDDPCRADAARDFDGEALPGPLVDDGQALELLSVGAGVEDEVVSPDVVAFGRRQWARPRRRHPPAQAL